MLPIIVIISLVFADQFSKYLVLTQLKPISQVVLIDGFFNLTYIENRGAAFGAMQGARWLFVTLAAVVIIAAVVYYAKMVKTKDNLWLRISIIMIGAGTIGNVIDRVYRGFVVDFLDFIIFGYDFPVFNVADVLIVIGTIVLTGGILIFDRKEEVNAVHS